MAGRMYGQIPYTDPTRAATVLMFTEQSKKALNAQQRAQLVMSGTARVQRIPGPVQ